MRHEKDFKRFIQNGDYEFTDGGILIHSSAMAGGKYYHTVNGQDEQVDPNLLPAAGILDILTQYFGGTAPSTFYLSLYSGDATPASTWTAANYVANATENTSQTEGYTGTTRPAWTPGTAAAGKIGNLSSRASYTIAATTTVTFYGAGLHTATATRGATTGVLVSSTRFAAARTLNDTDTFELGYEVELTDS